MQKFNIPFVCLLFKHITHGYEFSHIFCWITNENLIHKHLEKSGKSLFPLKLKSSTDANFSLKINQGHLHQ